jgi:hypothetical protein
VLANRPPAIELPRQVGEYTNRVGAGTSRLVVITKHEDHASRGTPRTGGQRVPEAVVARPEDREIHRNRPWRAGPFAALICGRKGREWCSQRLRPLRSVSLLPPVADSPRGVRDHGSPWLDSQTPVASFCSEDCGSGDSGWLVGGGGKVNPLRQLPPPSLDRSVRRGQAQGDPRSACLCGELRRRRAPLSSPRSARTNDARAIRSGPLASR